MARLEHEPHRPFTQSSGYLFCVDIDPWGNDHVGLDVTGEIARDYDMTLIRRSAAET